jgi:hypothetical protein
MVVVVLLFLLSVVGAQQSFYATRSSGVVGSSVPCTSQTDNCNFTFALQQAVASGLPADLVVAQGSFLVDAGLVIPSVASTLTIRGVGPFPSSVSITCAVGQSLLDILDTSATTLRMLTVRDCWTFPQGPVIQVNTGGQLKVDQCDFVNCTTFKAVSPGGVIGVHPVVGQNTFITITSSRFIDNKLIASNQANTGGAAVFGTDIAGSPGGVRLTIADCVFLRNNVSGALTSVQGGAVSILLQGTGDNRIGIRDSLFVANGVTDSFGSAGGGAVAVSQPGGLVSSAVSGVLVVLSCF